MYAHFYDRTITRVELYEHAVVIDMAQCTPSPFQLPVYRCPEVANTFSNGTGPKGTLASTNWLTSSQKRQNS
jgi:hypothetical protein